MRSAWLALAAAVIAAAVGCSAGSTEGYCDAATTMAADNPGWVFAAWDPATETDGGDLRRAARQLHRLAEAAPAEIEAEVGLIADTADEIAELLTELSGDDLARAMGDRAEDFDDVDEASRRVTDFTRTQCGIDFDAPPPPPTTTTTVPPTTTAS
jgi:hypothetical protein